MSQTVQNDHGRVRKRATLFTHAANGAIRDAILEAVEIANAAGWSILATQADAERHGLTGGELEIVAELPKQADLGLVLGGDGSVLRALRHHAGTDTAVYGINFGTVGFLAATEKDQLAIGLTRALSGDHEVLALPGLAVTAPGLELVAFNDVTFSRRPHGRVAELAYRIAGEEVGHVRCDGLVVATPTGSTGYNLANQGPILAWGVAGYVVSYIAPHSLTARALVVAPGDVLQVSNAASHESVELMIDGQPVGNLGSQHEAQVTFVPGAGRLAQLPGSSFYHRIREKFGHLAV